jgi:hypothetical protein
MVDSPQQDWSFYRAQLQSSDEAWIRGLTTSDRFAIYKDLFDAVWNCRQELGNWGHLDDWAWNQNLAARQQAVAAFTKLDQIRGAGSSPNNTR